MAETKLGQRLKGEQPTARQSAFALAAAAARPFVPWKISRLGIDTVITLVDFDTCEAIDAEVMKRMADLGLLDNRNRVEGARAVRYAARAVLDPVTHEPIGTVEEWRQLDDDVIGEFWGAYDDVRKAFDPFNGDLTKEEIDGITDAIKKNSAMLLRFYGARRLSTFLCSMAGQLLPLLEPSVPSTSSEPEISLSSTDG